MTLRVLLAESGTEDTVFLSEVLTELDGSRCWSDWVHLEASHAATWADTAAILATEAVDILLLDLDLRDSQGAETFRRVQAAAPDVPVILLVEPSATTLAERMVRDGAQDFLLKKEVDCAPLARAIRNALERHRLLAAARATSMTDQLTGLLTRPAFLALADRDRVLAERLSRKMMVVVTEHTGGAARASGTFHQGDQSRDLALIEAADDLRGLGGPAALLARLSHSRFGLAVLDTVAEPVEEIGARLHTAGTDGKLVFGAAVFDPQRPVSLDALLEAGRPQSPFPRWSVGDARPLQHRVGVVGARPLAGKRDSPGARSWQKVHIALDATYSLDRNLSGVGVYSREILFGLARSHPQDQFRFCYRPHRFLRSLRDSLPRNASRRILRGAPKGDLFHALNQRVDAPARRTVATFHDLFVITGEYSTPEFRARFADQARQAARRGDLIIAVSRFTAIQVEEFLGVESERIRVIPHGVHVRAEAPNTSRQNLVLFVGAIQRRKNVKGLVRAFERMPRSWRLALAGAAGGFGAAEELQAVESSPRRSDIDVLGYVTQAELEALYRRARIFAFPSLDEGFGMPVLDAMANSVPVITSQRSALPEVAGDAALLVNPDDPEEIAAALVRLASDQALCDDLARRGRARALQFSWEATLQKTWDVYRELTALK